jgi:hypothetical protein
MIKGRFGTRAALVAVCVFSISSGTAIAQSGATAGGMLGSDAGSMFRLFGSQGNSRGLNSISSSVTTLDGHTGYFAAGRLVPFVTGVVPVVGDQHRFLQTGQLGPYFDRPAMSTVQDRIARLQSEGTAPSSSRDGAALGTNTGARTLAKQPMADSSTAAEAVDSIAAIRRQREAALAEAYRVAAESFAKGALAATEGKSALAVYHFKIALRDGDETIRRKAAEGLRKLAVKE